MSKWPKKKEKGDQSAIIGTCVILDGKEQFIQETQVYLQAHEMLKVNTEIEWEEVCQEKTKLCDNIVFHA